MASASTLHIQPIPLVQTCSLFDVARCFDQAHRENRSLVRYVQLRVDNLGFPAPIIDLASDGTRITAVAPRSRWVRAAVEAWFHDQLPPDDVARITAVDVRNAERTLAARASHLQLVPATTGRAAA